MSTLFSAPQEVRRSLLVHAAALAVGVASTVFVIGIDDRSMLGRDVMFFPGLALGWFVGVGCALLRLRLWTVLAGSLLVCVAGSILIDSGLRELRLVGPVWFGLLFGAGSSFLFLTPRCELVSLWVPLGLSVGSSIGWLNDHHAVETWRRAKLAIWDGPSTIFLGLGVLMLVACLAARRRISIARWLHRETRVHASGPRPRAAGVVVVGVALVVLALGVSPFLFRTRAVSCEQDSSCSEDGPAQGRVSSDEQQQSTPARPAPPRLDDEAIQETLGRLRVWTPLLVERVLLVLAGAVLATLIALPLLRRRRLRALEQPSSSAPPTARVRARFERCLVALREGAVVVVGRVDAPRDLLDAARARLPTMPPGLKDAALLWERVLFAGRGLPDDAEADMDLAMRELLAWSRAETPVWRSLLLAFRLP